MEMWRHLVCEEIKSFNLFAKIVILSIFKFNGETS